MKLKLNLKELMKKKNVTAYRLAEDTGISKNGVYTLVSGKTTRIEFKTIELICEKLDCDISDLFTLEK